jgi:hypothetical protein
MKEAHVIFVRKSLEKRPLERPIYRWEDNTKVGVTKTQRENVE